MLCVQELREIDIPLLERALGASCFFAPMHLRLGKLEGIGIFSKLPAGEQRAIQYAGNTDEYKEFDFTNPRTKRNSQKYMLAVCGLVKHGKLFRIANTHFTWTPHGKADDSQHEDVKSLLRKLDWFGELVLCGDFNAPRGGEIFTKISQKYTDHVPPHYTTSLDGNYHRAGHLELMVDGIFSTPAYHVSEVSMTSGLSDHCAISALIQKRNQVTV